MNRLSLYHPTTTISSKARRVHYLSNHKTANNILAVFFTFLAALLFLSASGSALAINASPHSYTVTQPDGTVITLHINGSEHYNWESDVNGFTVIQENGWYYFAKLDPVTKRLVASGLRVGIDNPASQGLAPRILPEPADRGRSPVGLPGEASGEIGASIPATAPAASGTLRNLVVMIRWSDHVGRTIPSEADIDVLMNHNGAHTLAPTGSVRDVYLENSYGVLTIESTVYAWVTVDNTEAYYADNNSGLTTKIHGALTYALNVLDADPAFNFTDFDQDHDNQIDSITFLHSGYGAEWGGNDCYGSNYQQRIWSHKWVLSNDNWNGWVSSDGVRVSTYNISTALWGTCGTEIGRIGVVAHELGHYLGLPDLYDTDGSGSGVGSYDMMANAWGFDGSQHYPPHMSAWSKYQMGWIVPATITANGNYVLPAVESSASVYLINRGYNSGEYLLVENRQPTGFDLKMPQGGLAIWHIDDSLADYSNEGYPGQPGWPTNGKHYRVALLQADGAYDLEHGYDSGDDKDLWHAGFKYEIGPYANPVTGPFPNTDTYQGGAVTQTGNRIYNISTSASTMSFSYEKTAPQSIILSSTGYLSRGSIIVDLNWSGAAAYPKVVIKRKVDGGNLVNYRTVLNNGRYTDRTGLKGAHTLVYQVCTTDGAICSNQVTQVF
ncbi:MAG: M6 family metalloprotease domain-containing protein [Pseudomonadota bacterium]